MLLHSPVVLLYQILLLTICLVFLLVYRHCTWATHSFLVLLVLIHVTPIGLVMVQDHLGILLHLVLVILITVLMNASFSIILFRSQVYLDGVRLLDLQWRWAVASRRILFIGGLLVRWLREEVHGDGDLGLIAWEDFRYLVSLGFRDRYQCRVLLLMEGRGYWLVFLFFFVLERGIFGRHVDFMELVFIIVISLKNHEEGIWLIGHSGLSVLVLCS